MDKETHYIYHRSLRPSHIVLEYLRIKARKERQHYPLSYVRAAVKKFSNHPGVLREVERRKEAVDIELDL